MLKRLAFLACLLAAAAPAQARSFLVVTDPHFDPMADTALAPALAEAPVEQWAAILGKMAGGGLGRFGVDPGWPLVQSALDAMRRTEKQPDIVMVLGDLLAHDFHEAFNNTAIKDRSAAGYRSFVVKAVTFLASELAQRFPDAVVLPAVGNNDDDCGDYAVEANGPFLADTMEAARRLVGKAAAPDFADTWRATGSYTARLGPHLRAVSLNTVFFSRRYKADACRTPPTTPEEAPARAVLDYLAKALAAAEQAGDKVWLLYHIPPGADAYQTQRRGACPDGAVPMWPAAITREFLALTHRYRDTVVAGFAGHTHMDEFRLLRAGGGAAADGFVLVTPAISPIFGQNPAFARYTAGDDGRLLDRSIVYLANLEGVAAGEAADWRAEYDFVRAWRVDALEAASLAALDRRIGEVPADRTQWEHFFSVSRPQMWQAQGGTPTPSAAALRVHWCTEHTVDPAAFGLCVCAGKDD